MAGLDTARPSLRSAGAGRDTPISGQFGGAGRLAGQLELDNNKGGGQPDTAMALQALRAQDNTTQVICQLGTTTAHQAVGA